jgi:predicted protein tyrosine phosphatase
MPRVFVCPLSRVSETVIAADASHLVSLINHDTPVERPAAIREENHLFLGINDIIEPTDGMITPAEEHVLALIDFVTEWDRARPVVVHCFAGISRSTAAAYISLCALRPDRNEAEIARSLRAASPFATPNPRLVSFGDSILRREGRMVDAIKGIGRGEVAFESRPFALPVTD